MSTDTDNRTPEEIERDIARTRDEMSATIDELQSRMSPGQLLDQGLAYLRSSGAGDFGSNLGRSVRDNPMPVALVGVGLAWLMMGGQRRGAGEPRDTLRDTASQVADRARNVKDRAADLTQRSIERAQDARDSALELFDRHPMVLGGLGLALGGVVAAMLPGTRTEDRLMGDTRDGLLDEAQRGARAGAEGRTSPQAPMSPADAAGTMPPM